VYNCIYFVSKPEIGLHILSHLKPENFEKQKKQKSIFWNSLGKTPSTKPNKTLEKNKKTKNT